VRDQPFRNAEATAAAMVVLLLLPLAASCLRAKA